MVGPRSPLCSKPAAHTVRFAHCRSLVGVARTVKYCVSQSQTVRLVHRRSVVRVGAAVWYCELLQIVSSVQAKSLVRVAGPEIKLVDGHPRVRRHSVRLKAKRLEAHRVQWLGTPTVAIQPSLQTQVLEVALSVAPVGHTASMSWRKG